MKVSLWKGQLFVWVVVSVVVVVVVVVAVVVEVVVLVAETESCRKAYLQILFLLSFFTQNPCGFSLEWSVTMLDSNTEMAFIFLKEETDGVAVLNRP